LIVVGLMSGTSLDGIDAAVVEVTGDTTDSVQWKILAFRSSPYTEERRSRIRECIEVGNAGLLCALHADLGEWFAQAVLGAVADAGLEMTAVDLIASHGQTVWHIPPGTQSGQRFGLETPRGASLQLGDAATIAQRTGVDVVADFRARDLAVGGHGAPLVPWLDKLLFGLEDRGRCLQNLGGMGNVAWLPPRNSKDAIIAFDTGPGTALIDAAVRQATNGLEAYDVEGAMAAAGKVNESVVSDIMAYSFFRQPPPRSTGRELFSSQLVHILGEEQGLVVGDKKAWCDLVASLTEVTARSIADAYRRWLPTGQVSEVILAGGGSLNRELVQRIRANLDPIPVRSLEALGVDPEAKEALAFALLGWAYRHRIAGNLPEVTGALGPVVLGTMTPGVVGTMGGEGVDCAQA